MKNTFNQRIEFTTSADNTQIAYALSGEGTPVVRAGTWLTHIQHDWDSPIWSHWFRLMSEKNTLVRYDPRGCGLSQRNIADITLDQWVDDLAAVVDANDLNSFPLFGMSQGAAVSVMYALRYPERVSQLILYAPLITGWKGSKNPLSTRWKAMETLVDSGWGEENLAFPTMFAQLFTPGANPEQILWFAQTQKKSADKIVAGKIMKALSEIRVFSLLDQLKVPTIVIQVAGDQAVSPDSTRGIAAKIPNCQFVSIDSSNHILLENEPAWNDFCKLYRLHISGADEAINLDFVVDKNYMEVLSKREQDVLAELSKGLSNKLIAQSLFISEKTVRNHITNIFGKLGVSSRAEALVLINKAAR